MAKGKKREDKKKEEPPPKKNDFKSFLRKRAPIYLALIALLVVFVIPELTKGDLEKSLPELSAEDQQIVDILMGYNGPNQAGLTVMEAISNKISEEYPDEKIYDNKKTKVSLVVSNIDSEKHQVLFTFESHKGTMNYDWNVNVNSGDITANNPESKHILDLVDFYD